METRMANELNGKVAIITGGSKGIGAATAEVFVEEGAKVVIADVDVANGEALAKRLGTQVRFRPTDVANKNDVQALIDYAVAEFGALHVMFNNAAISGTFHNRFLDDTLEDFDKVMHINLAGVMFGSQSAARHMAKNGGGSIINMSSISALDPSYAVFTYRAAKTGVINFTKSLAVDLGEYGIRVNAIAPGHIPTSLNHFPELGLSMERVVALQKALEPVWMTNQPLKRQGSPRDVANTALFLASERSAQISGQVIAVDGAITAGDPTNLHAMLVEAREKFLRS
jgi:NAD(P)-dependent dehydrogenase (short-subunit alcohol dehydrogenase family)